MRVEAGAGATPQPWICWGVSRGGSRWPVGGAEKPVGVGDLVRTVCSPVSYRERLPW